jgi:hypothetical protein
LQKSGLQRLVPFRGSDIVAQKLSDQAIRTTPAVRSSQIDGREFATAQPARIIPSTTAQWMMLSDS